MSEDRSRLIFGPLYPEIDHERSSASNVLPYMAGDRSQSISGINMLPYMAEDQSIFDHIW